MGRRRDLRALGDHAVDAVPAIPAVDQLRVRSLIDSGFPRPPFDGNDR
jgi:hypothetical protein